ncbi:MAG TPA: TetR/AcrR family transcriptional regulator [Aeromicrobium sp.]|nr:TetR/AcrR family transcriptional regulator [Aeromicrobium sp.]
MRLLVTRDDYYEAAMRILATEGAGGIKITKLCSALGVTTGSFYGYFGSLDGFVDAFLEYWWEGQTARIVEMANAPDDPADRIRLMRKLASQLPHAAEGAIRSWGHTNIAVAAMQEKVDAARSKALADVLRPAAADDNEARTLGIMAMTLLVGLQQWRQPVTTEDFNLLFNEFEKLVLMNLDPSTA